MLPLTDRPHRDALGAFFDDDLAALVRPGGRLDRVLRAAETAAIPAGMRTLAVDPELLEELRAMSSGYVVGPSVVDFGAAGTAPSAPSVTPAPSSTPPSSTPPSSPQPGPTQPGPTQPGSTRPSPTQPGTTAGTPSPTRPGTAPPGTGTGGSTAAGDSTLDAVESTTSAVAASVDPPPAGDTTTPGTATGQVPSRTSSLVSPAPSAVPGVGSAAAADFLKRLRAVAGTMPTIVLPYGDLDLVAAVRADRADDLTAAVTRGRTVATEVLGALPTLISDLTWPIDGLVDQRTLTALRTAGDAVALLDDSGVVSRTSDPTSIAAAVRTGSGPITALLATGPTPADATALNIFTAVTAQNFFSAKSRPAVLTPDRAWDPGVGSGLIAVLADLSRAGIVRGAPLAAFRSVGTATAVPDYPDDAADREVPTTAFERVAALRADLRQLQAVFTRLETDAATDPAQAPTTLFDSVSDGLLRQGAGGYRYAPEARGFAASRVSQFLSAVQEQVAIIPQAAAYTLTSTSSPILLTIRNQTPYTAHLRILVNPDDAQRAGIAVGDVGVQTVAAGRAQQVQLPAEVTRAGFLSLRVQLTSPDGTLWGSSQTLQMRSTAYGAFTVSMIIGAAVVVVLTTAGRIRKRLRQRTVAGGGAAA